MDNTDPKQNDEPELNLENVTPLEQPQTESGMDELSALKIALAETNDKMMRALAEAENTRRRAKLEREDAAKFAVSAFAKDLLDFSDNFHRALDAIPAELQSDERVAQIVTGLQAMDAVLLKTFERHGIQKVEPLDQPFNPNFHEVMFEAPMPGKLGGTVIQVIDAGYTLNGRLLRAAKVGIAKADASGSHQVDQEA